MELEKTDNLKRYYGKFYTIANPFKVSAFYDWFYSIPKEKRDTLLEPFAGANNILSLLYEINIDSQWVCYDIDPPSYNTFDLYTVSQRDTIEDFPKGFNVAITNPPYLAKNSASRRNLNFPVTTYDDLYKLSLAVMLENVEYVAAIIPESFITQGLFHDRLNSVVSLNCKMFEDTECPVCLAMFSPEITNDFKIYHQDNFIGRFSNLKEHMLFTQDITTNWRFNDSQGSVGLYAIDNQTSSSIKFCTGSTIPEDRVSGASRTITRISGLPNDVNIEDFICICNQILDDYRVNTHDVFLTPFKGLRKDNKYRRRLDYKSARNILNKSLKIYYSRQRGEIYV